MSSILAAMQMPSSTGSRYDGYHRGRRPWVNWRLTTTVAPSMTISQVLTTRTATTPTTRRVAGAMEAIAASLAVASAIHLFGTVSGRNDLYDASDAGIAEAIIGVALLAGGLPLWRSGRQARTPA